MINVSFRTLFFLFCLPNLIKFTPNKSLHCINNCPRSFTFHRKGIYDISTILYLKQLSSNRSLYFVFHKLDSYIHFMFVFHYHRLYFMIIINLNFEQGKGKVVTKEVTQILRAWPRMRVDN